MMKASAMFSVHAIHVLLRNTLISLVVIFIALFFWLKSGVEIDSLHIGKYKIEKLYLKLDKKLTLKVKNVVIPKSKSKPSFKNIDKTFDKIKYLFTFFDEIDFENVYFKDNRIHFVFVDDILYITSDDYEIAGNIQRVEKRLVAEVSMLKLKKLDIALKGSLNYNLTSYQLNTKGNFNAFGITGSFLANKKDKQIDFNITSNTFTDLKFLTDRLPIKEKIKVWIVKKIQAQKYKLNRLEGEGIVTSDGFKLNFNTLKATLYVEGAKIYYHKDLAPVVVDSFTLKYRDYTLKAMLDKPRYLDRNLEKSKVTIDGLGTARALLKLDLHIQTLFDDEVKKILKVYNVHIPLKQKGELVVADIKLDVPLTKKDKNKKTAVNVTIHMNQAEVEYGNIALPIKKASIQFDNNHTQHINVEAILANGTIKLGKTNLSVLGGRATYTNDKVILDRVHIKDSWYEAVLSGKVNLIKKEAKLNAKIKWLHIGEKKKVVVIKNETLPLNIMYKNNLKLEFPSVGIVLENKKNNMHIYISDIQKIKFYLKNMPINVDGGNIDILKKSGIYTFEGHLKKSCFFYNKNGLCYTSIPFSAIAKNGYFTFYAFGKRLEYKSKQSRLKLKNIHIDLKNFLEEKSRQVSKIGKGKKLVILGENSKIKYKKHILVTDSYDIEISPEGDVFAMGSLSGEIVNFSKKGKIFTLKALRIKDNMLHPLIGFDGIKDGRYSITLSGNPDENMKGKIIIEGGVMKNFKVYNNTLALINALPALATFSNPGFSEKGFNIQEGVIDYHMIKDNIILDSIYIKGKSATIIGKGKLNIKKETIHIDLAIHTARELGKVVGNLPLLGYILLGKDKSVTVGLSITGTFKKPQVNTSATKDILTLPLNLIRRIFESPAHIINK